MTNLTGPSRARYVQRMFGQISRHYDKMNRLMTFTQDVRWRREVVRRASFPDHALVLDLGAGTGDLAREVCRQVPTAHVVAADFTLQMLQVGQAKKHMPAKLDWAGADALNLPFASETFDGLLSGFLLRNVSDLARSLEEQWRVLKPGGHWACLETTPPPPGLLAPFIQFYLHRVVPALGRLVSGHGAAYTYLPDSTEKFLEPGQLRSSLEQAGFKKAGFRRLNFGTVAIHWALK